MYGIYKIQNGDTLDSLAKRYGVSPEILKNLNQNSNFAVGSNIIVPTMNEYFEVYTTPFKKEIIYIILQGDIILIIIYWHYLMALM